MEVSELMSIIGSVGFPIVACMAMGYYCYTIMETHRKEVDKLSEAINEMRVVIESIKVLLER